MAPDPKLRQTEIPAQSVKGDNFLLFMKAAG